MTGTSQMCSRGSSSETDSGTLQLGTVTSSVIHYKMRVHILSKGNDFCFYFTYVCKRFDQK